MVEPGAPGQRPRAAGVPKDKGVPREAGVLPTEGVPREQGVPRTQGPLPGTPGRRLPGDPGQVLPGTPGQMHKQAENPWAPSQETVVPEEDLVLPASRPPEPAEE